MIGFLCGLSVLNNSFYNRQIVYFIIWFQTAAFDELVQDTWWYLSSIYTVCFGYFNLHCLFIWSMFSLAFGVCFLCILMSVFALFSVCCPYPLEIVILAFVVIVFRASWSLFFVPPEVCFTSVFSCHYFERLFWMNLVVALCVVRERGISFPSIWWSVYSVICDFVGLFFHTFHDLWMFFVSLEVCFLCLFVLCLPWLHQKSSSLSWHTFQLYDRKLENK